MGDKTDYFKDLNNEVDDNSSIIIMSDGISLLEEVSDPRTSLTNRYNGRKTSSLQSIIDALKYTSGLKRTNMVTIMLKCNKPFAKQDKIDLEHLNSLKDRGDADINQRQWRRLSNRILSAAVQANKHFMSNVIGSSQSTAERAKLVDSFNVMKIFSINSKNIKAITSVEMNLIKEEIIDMLLIIHNEVNKSATLNSEMTQAEVINKYESDKAIKANRGHEALNSSLVGKKMFDRINNTESLEYGSTCTSSTAVPIRTKKLRTAGYNSIAVHQQSVVPSNALKSKTELLEDKANTLINQLLELTNNNTTAPQTNHTSQNPSVFADNNTINVNICGMMNAKTQTTCWYCKLDII